MQNYFTMPNKYLFYFLCFVALMFFNSCGEDVSLNSPNVLVVIIKADDLGDTTPNWNRFIRMVSDNGICAGIGVISKFVTTEGSISEIQRLSALKQSNNFPTIEFWNHGYDHSKVNDYTEFYKTSYEYQLNHIHMAQNFFTSRLHLTSNSFGAPFNRTSTETASALNDFPEINVWQYYEKIEKQYQKEWKDPNQRVINEIDQHIILNVDYLFLHNFPSEKVTHNYNHDKNKPYILVQIHPAYWDEKSFNKFEQFIHFYRNTNRAVFMTPYQYYLYLHMREPLAPKGE